ncbi:unnamed protein product, partial [Closterium sp. NIES-53]
LALLCLTGLVTTCSPPLCLWGVGVNPPCIPWCRVCGVAVVGVARKGWRVSVYPSPPPPSSPTAAAVAEGGGCVGSCGLGFKGGAVLKGVAAEKPAAPVARETVAPVAREPVAPVAREPVALVARESIARLPLLLAAEPVTPVARVPVPPVASVPVAPIAPCTALQALLITPHFGYGEPRRPTELHCPALAAPAATAASAVTVAPSATAATAAMASPTVLTFDAEGRAVDFNVWVDDLQLFLQSDSRDGVYLFDHTSGVSTAPAATADSKDQSGITSGPLTVVAHLAVHSHLPPAERVHFDQYKTAQSLYNAVFARYSSPATAALSRLMLPYLFPDLASFATVAHLTAHLRTSDARYRAALPTEFCAKNPPPCTSPFTS